MSPATNRTSGPAALFPARAQPRLAIVGSGIAGLAAAHTLQGLADLTLFEAEAQFGGELRSVDIVLPDAQGQTSALMRLLPVGQSGAQRILQRALPVIERCVERASALPDDAIGNFAPGLALASARHETQYSRLFR